MFLGLSPVKYFQRCVTSQIPRADLEAALMLLPMQYIVRFLGWVEMMLVFGSTSEIETATRCLVTLLLCHSRALTSQSSVLLPHFLRMREYLTEKMDAFKSMLGMNQAAFRFLQHQIETEQDEKAAFQQAFYPSVTETAAKTDDVNQPKRKKQKR